MYSSARRLVVLSVCAIALAGCGMFSKPETRPCPRVSMLNEANTVTQYKPGPGRDLIDVAFTAQIANLRSQCKYDDDRLIVGTEVAIAAERGPAASGRTAQFAMFIAVTDGAQGILAKEVFDSAIEFPAGQRRAAGAEEFEQTIPLAEGQTGDNYEIIVGFQLSEEQLKMNRARKF